MDELTNCLYQMLATDAERDSDGGHPANVADGIFYAARALVEVAKAIEALALRLGESLDRVASAIEGGRE